MEAIINRNEGPAGVHPAGCRKVTWLLARLMYWCTDVYCPFDCPSQRHDSSLFCPQGAFIVVSCIFFMLPLIICDYSYSLGFGLLTLPLILTPAWLRFSSAACLDSITECLFRLF